MFWSRNRCMTEDISSQSDFESESFSLLTEFISNDDESSVMKLVITLLNYSVVASVTTTNAASGATANQE